MDSNGILLFLDNTDYDDSGSEYNPKSNDSFV